MAIVTTDCDVQGRGFQLFCCLAQHRDANLLNANFNSSASGRYSILCSKSFVMAAEAGFDFERGLFNEGQGNWPDLRLLPGERTPNHRYSIPWCHGAAGISLAMLRAYQLTGKSGYLEECRRGMAVTASSIAEIVDDQNASHCLCHGTFGNLECILSYGRCVSNKHVGFAERAALQLVDTSVRQGRGWRSGLVSRAKNASLMLGMAGIGYALLRLTNNKIPSVLYPACPSL
jgi:lantibiotic biosynthesis protein